MRRERESTLKHLLSRSRKHYAKERCQDLIQFPLHFILFSAARARALMSRRQKQYAQVKTEKMAISIGSHDHCAPKKITLLQTDFLHYGSTVPLNKLMVGEQG